jgi:hypothetical protein
MSLPSSSLSAQRKSEYTDLHFKCLLADAVSQRRILPKIVEPLDYWSDEGKEDKEDKEVADHGDAHDKGSDRHTEREDEGHGSNTQSRVDQTSALEDNLEKAFCKEDDDPPLDVVMDMTKAALCSLCGKTSPRDEVESRELADYGKRYVLCWSCSTLNSDWRTIKGCASEEDRMVTRAASVGLGSSSVTMFQTAKESWGYLTGGAKQVCQVVDTLSRLPDGF